MLSRLLWGAIFDFFYAWVCSILWGLDRIDPNTAFTAMQAMNASARRVVFAPAFFTTSVVWLANTLLPFICHNRRAALCFAMAGLVCGLGGIALTKAMNVLISQAFALIKTPIAPAQVSVV